MFILIIEDFKVTYFLTCFVLFWRVSKEPTFRLETFLPRLWCGAVAKFKKEKSPKSANVILFSYDEDDVELGVCAKEKGKIDSEVGTTNSDNDFLNFKSTSTIKVIIRKFLMWI